MLAERHGDAHDEDIVGVAFSARDHEESYPARSRSIRHSDDQGPRRSPGHYARGGGAAWLVSTLEKPSASSGLLSNQRTSLPPGTGLWSWLRKLPSRCWS